jgi:hypothetical protein
MDNVIHFDSAKKAINAKRRLDQYFGQIKDQDQQELYDELRELIEEVRSTDCDSFTFSKIKTLVNLLGKKPYTQSEQWQGLITNLNQILAISDRRR